MVGFRVTYTRWDEGEVRKPRQREKGVVHRCGWKPHLLLEIPQVYSRT
ncbi:MAG: hypothetical protein OXN25_22235 [Candidatus Poribacteria bacterium]|nr:hypothetical protein [Candidatus Poribacteria bacterium]